MKRFIAKFTALRNGSEHAGKLVFLADDLYQARVRAGALVQIALFTQHVYVDDADITVHSIRRKWF